MDNWYAGGGMIKGKSISRIRKRIEKRESRRESRRRKGRLMEIKSKDEGGMHGFIY